MQVSNVLTIRIVKTFVWAQCPIVVGNLSSIQTKTVFIFKCSGLLKLFSESVCVCMFVCWVKNISHQKCTLVTCNNQQPQVLILLHLLKQKPLYTSHVIRDDILVPIITSNRLHISLINIHNILLYFDKKFCSEKSTMLAQVSNYRQVLIIGTSKAYSLWSIYRLPGHVIGCYGV